MCVLPFMTRNLHAFLTVDHPRNAEAVRDRAITDGKERFLERLRRAERGRIYDNAIDGSQLGQARVAKSADAKDLKSYNIKS